MNIVNYIQIVYKKIKKRKENTKEESSKFFKNFREATKELPTSNLLFLQASFMILTLIMVVLSLSLTYCTYQLAELIGSSILAKLITTGIALIIGSTILSLYKIGEAENLNLNIKTMTKIIASLFLASSLTLLERITKFNN